LRNIGKQSSKRPRRERQPLDQYWPSARKLADDPRTVEASWASIPALSAEGMERGSADSPRGYSETPTVLVLVVSLRLNRPPKKRRSESKSSAVIDHVPASHHTKSAPKP
jgi:hypothetical protein